VDRPEGSGTIASIYVLGEAGASGLMAAAPDVGLGAGPSGEGMSWAVVQRGVSEDFVRAECDEDKIWQEQL